MGKLKKSVIKQDLARTRVLINDTQPTSEYFQLRQVPEVLTSGKNAFLINGSSKLIPTTKVLIEITDINGDTIFEQPIRGYEEGLARVESIEIYEDTPAGPALITILGEAEFMPDGKPVPFEWVGKYNVKWQKTVNVQPFAPNSTKIRLYETPILNVSEFLVQYRNAITSSVQYTSGSASLAVAGIPPVTSSNLSYTLINSTIPFSRSYEGSLVYSQQNSYTSSIISVLNSSSAVVTNGVLPSGSGFSLSDITIEYIPVTTFQGTALTRSYADIRLSKLTTFSGDVARAKIYVKSVDQPTDYQLIEDIILESTPILVTQSLVGSSLSSGEREIYIGYFDNQSIIDTYWQTGIADSIVGYIPTGSVTASYSSTKLVDSVRISNIPALITTGSLYPQYFIGTIQDVGFESNAEYTFSAKAVCVKSAGFSAQMDVYLTGSSFPTTNPLGVKIQSFTVSSQDKFKRFDPIEFNFVSKRSGSASLNFVIYGGDWHISDVELDSSRETGFNPDEARVLAPIINRRFERLQFKAELYDPNNNVVPILIESQPIFFDGGNYVFKGDDHRVEGQIEIIPSGANSGLTGIKLTTKGFFSGGSGGLPGTFQSGSSIHIGSGSVFTKETPFIVASNLAGSPEISIGDKLYGYIDPITNEFVLKIIGTVLIGSGSNFVDIRNLLPRSPKDAQFARVTAQVGDFWDLRGRYSVTAGEIQDQISRMGNYTREKFPAVWQPSINLPDINFSYDAYNTSSIVLGASASIDLSTGIGIFNNTIYLNGLLQMTAHTASQAFIITYNVETLSSWTSYPNLSQFGTVFGGDDYGFVVTQTGSVLTANTLNFPVTVPPNRTGNTLFFTVKITVNTQVSS